MGTLPLFGGLISKEYFKSQIRGDFPGAKTNRLVLSSNMMFFHTMDWSPSCSFHPSATAPCPALQVVFATSTEGSTPLVPERVRSASLDLDLPSATAQVVIPLGVIMVI